MKTEDKNKPAINNYMRYSGIGFQLAGSVGLGVFIGYELDKWLKTPAPYFTIACSLIFMAGGFYLVFRDLLKNK